RNRPGRGPRIDASYEMPDGTAFRDVQSFKTLAKRDKAEIAKCVATHLITYGTGATVAFADRAAIAKIVDQSKRGDAYGLRTLVENVVTSELFTGK
ncbi:MAG: DUF1585 domain-containing protein, partial [Planctomycetota bacterium]